MSPRTDKDQPSINLPFCGAKEEALADGRGQSYSSMQFNNDKQKLLKIKPGLEPNISIQDRSKKN